MAKIKSLQSSTGVSAGTVSTLALGGSGEINYIENPSDVTAGWTASGAGVTCTTYTTTADLPRQITEGTGIKLTGVSGSTAYMYYRFTLDRSDYGKKLKVVWDQAPISGYSASHFKVDVYSNTASDYTGTSTRLSLSTDSSSVTGIPNLTGSFRTTFDAPSSTAPYIEVRIGLNGAYTSSCVFSNIIVGPGIVTQGAAVGQWTSFTPVSTWVSNATHTGAYRRVGQEMEGWVKIALTGAPTSATLTLNIPSGFTIDTVAANSDTDNINNGLVTIVDASPSNQYLGAVGYATSSTFTPTQYVVSSARVDRAVITQASPITFASGDEIHITFKFPIAEWAGSGTVNVVQNDVEYLSGVGTWGTSSGPTLVSGPGGSLGGTTTPAGTNFYYEFTPVTPVSSNTRLDLEVSVDGIRWAPIGAPGLPMANVDCLRYDGTNYIGIGIDARASGSIRVYFGKYCTGTSTAWTGTWYWRVKKSSGGQAVGFGEVQPGIAAGLVSSSGLKGSTSGTATAAGYVGEILKSTFTSSSTSPTNTQFGNATSISLTAGTWLLYGAVMNTRVASQTVMQLAISAYSNNTTTDHVNGVNVQRFDAPSWNITSMSVGPWPVNISAGATYYLKVYQDAGSFTAANWQGNLTAVRIA